MTESGKQRKFGWLEVITAIVTAFLIGNGAFNFLKAVGIPTLSLPSFNSEYFAFSPLIFGSIILACFVIVKVLQDEKLPITIGSFAAVGLGLSLIWIILACFVIVKVLQDEKLPITIGSFAAVGLGLSLIWGFVTFLNTTCDGQTPAGLAQTWNPTMKCYVVSLSANFSPMQILFGTSLWVIIIMVLYMIIRNMRAKKQGITHFRLPYPSFDGEHTAF